MATSTMFKVHKDSGNVVTDAFAQMDVPPTDASIDRAAWESVVPVGELKATGDLEWYVNSDIDYTDTAASFFEFAVRVSKADGTVLDGDDGALVWPGDNFAHSLFEKITVSLGSNNIEYAPYYLYRAYMENLLNYSKDVKKSTLATSSGWTEDLLTASDFGDTVDGKDDAVKVRKAMVSGHKTLSFYTRMRMSTLSLSRYMYPNMPLR